MIPKGKQQILAGDTGERVRVWILILDVRFIIHTSHVFLIWTGLKDQKINLECKVESIHITTVCKSKSIIIVNKRSAAKNNYLLNFFIIIIHYSFWSK